MVTSDGFQKCFRIGFVWSCFASTNLICFFAFVHAALALPACVFDVWSSHHNLIGADGI
jgi:hypothetical protein